MKFKGILTRCLILSLVFVLTPAVALADEEKDTGFEGWDEETEGDTKPKDD
ncbi:MAG: hypothetical protein JRJ19_13255 [Deltaproteobacteria bacterium]|nr:hypothetical protein [Deltaproteobacteria bacterium]